MDTELAPPIGNEAIFEEPKARPAALDRRRAAIKFLRALGMALLIFILSLAGSAIAVVLFGTRTYHWRAFEIEAGIQPSLHGETRLIFTPLGEVRARTHITPVALNIGLKSISFEEMKLLIASPPPRKALELDFERTAKRCIRDLAIRETILGAVGALVVPLLFRLKRFRYWLLCALWGGGFVAILYLGILQSFNKAAFENPSYTGSLRQAEWVITLVKDGFNKVEALSDKLRHVANNLNTLYSRINAVPGFAADVNTIHILHISDIHNNPAAIRFVRELADKMQVQMVIDTGDLSDFGTPLESNLSRGLSELHVPYLFVAGNHDSQATIDGLKNNPNAIILNGQRVTAAGLTIWGEPDPVSLRASAGSVDNPPEVMRGAADKLLENYLKLKDPPDIVCVHNPLQAELLIGKVKLVLCGHEHRRYIEVRNNTVLCNAGTTGAAGARYFDSKNGVPFSAEILTFSKGAKPQLLFVDQVALEGSLSQYSIQRRSFNGASGPLLGAVPGQTGAAAASQLPPSKPVRPAFLPVH
jgi:predicted MPP superfamily phosphohydrolase